MHLDALTLKESKVFHILEAIKKRVIDTKRIKISCLS